MSLWDAEVLVPWELRQDETGMQYYAPSIDGRLGNFAWEDTTGQPGESIPPAPNLLVVRVRVDSATLEQLRNDATYTVLWSKSVEGQLPDEQSQPVEEHLNGRDVLQVKGLSSEAIDEVVGTVDHSLNRREQVESLKDWLRGLPKSADPMAAIALGAIERE